MARPAPAHPPAGRHSARGHRAVVAAALATVLAVPGCLFTRSQPGVLLASTPPGATIVVDGRDSGFVTPANLSLPRAEWHRVEFHLAGHVPEARLLAPGRRVYLIPWTDGYVGVGTWYFPLFLSFEHLAFPLRIDDNLVPQRVHVRLAGEGDDG